MINDFFKYKGPPDGRPLQITSPKRKSNPAFDHHLLDLGNRLGRIEAYRAGLGAATSCQDEPSWSVRISSTMIFKSLKWSVRGQLRTGAKSCAKAL
ncbi:hypothetical protein CHH27_21825 [Labrenzia sp. VG12]|nr:hypothetical protein CHH27_21825 [Labrenzia sp. VG12]